MTTHPDHHFRHCHLLEILLQRRPGVVIEPLLHEGDDLAVVPCVRILQVLSDPCLDVGNFREGILRGLLASVQLCEAYAEAQLVDIGIYDDIVVLVDSGRVDQQLDQFLSREVPSLGVPIYESLGIGEGLGEGDHGGLAIHWTSQFLRVGKDDAEVDALENAGEA